MIANVGAVRAIESNLVKIKMLSYASAGLHVAATISSYIPFLNPIIPTIQILGTAGICGATLLNRLMVSHLFQANAADDDTIVQKTQRAFKETAISIVVSAVCSGRKSVCFPWLFGSAVFTYLSHESLMDNFLLVRPYRT